MPRNVEAVREWVEAYNRRDVARMVAVSAPDIEFRSAFAGIESGGVFRGYAGMVDYFKAISDAYERFEVIPEEFLDAGAGVLVVARADWSGKGSGITASTPVYPAMWLRAAKVFRVETFADRDEALDAMGLRG